MILLTGYTVAAVRGWREVAWASGAGATFWALANLGDADNVPAAVLLTSAPAAAIAADLWRRRIGWQALAGDPPPSAPLVALAASALASLSLWLPNNGLDPGAAAAGLGVALALLAAFAAIVRAAPAWVQPPVYITLATGALANWNGVGLAMAPDRAPAAAAVLFGLVVAGAGAAWAPRERIARLYAAIGPAVAALGLTVVVGIVRSTAFDLAWVLPTTAAALTGLVATGLGGRSEDARTDLALAIWIWSCALLATVAVTAGLAWQAKAIGVTVLTLVAAALHARLAWRGFGAAAIALAVTVLVVVAGVGARTLDGQAPAWAMALIFTVATLGLWGASRVSRAGGPRQPLSDALSTGALIAGVMGALFLLRLQGPGQAAGLEPLLEAGLGVVLLLAAGLLTARGRTEDAGWLGRWRPHLFLMAGVAYGVAGPLFVLNPFWADAGLPIKGPPIFDTLLLAYLAPAALLIPCVGRRISPVHGLSGLYAAASAIFALGWAALEIRRLFKGPAFAWGPEAFGRAEGCAYALLAFAAALALGWIARKFRERAAEPAPIVDDLRAGGEILEGLAAALAAVVFGFAANPWWGPITRPFSDHPAAILLLALHAVGVGAWLLIARLSARFGAVARVGAALQLFVLITLMVRYGFRGLDMHTAQSEARIETWAFSAIWALYGVAVLALGAFRKDMVLRWTGLVLLLATTAKVFLFDMARLDGMVRAASFLAVGALLIAAALAARRFGGLNLVKREAEEGA